MSDVTMTDLPVRQLTAKDLGYEWDDATVPSTTASPSDEHLDSLPTEALRLLRELRNVVLYGAPGTGKTWAAFKVAEWWRGTYGSDSVVKTTFHPSYSYESFIQGWRPDAKGEFILKPGVLLEAAGRCAHCQEVLLIIDEINRGDVARIFGEAITYIEYDKREETFYTAYDATTPVTIPSNLHLLGTMNTADKSISLLDIALRRRFAFIPFPPDPSVFAANPAWLASVDTIALGDLLTAINRRLDEQDIEVDRQIGHALLGIPKTTSDPSKALIDRVFYDILPLVEEYLYSDTEAINQVLPGIIDRTTRRPVRPESLDVIHGWLSTPTKTVLPPEDEETSAEVESDFEDGSDEEEFE